MRSPLTLLSAAMFAFALPVAAFAQDLSQYGVFAEGSTAQVLAAGEVPSGEGTVFIPNSSLAQPADALGPRMHTMLEIFVPDKKFPASSIRPTGVPATGYFFNTPQSLACVYALVAVTAGCNPDTLLDTKHAVGGSRAVGIVIAFHHPTALTDLAQFSTQFHLQAPNLQVITMPGTGADPDPQQGWGLELAMDMESVHSMAPNAKIIVVEGKSTLDTDLMAAEDKASAVLGAAPFSGGEINNSFGRSETSSITGLDAHFKKPKIVYFASSGDKPGVNWPSSSPNVVSVGGTSISRSPTTHAFLHEASWDDAGGGPSAFFARPAYQNQVSAIVGAKRGTPDVSADANPKTGVWVRFTGAGGSGWFFVGGTSLASPLTAGIANNGAAFRPSSNAELTAIYAALGVAAKFNDIKLGICGPFAGYTAVAGYEFCTGVGSPHGKTGL